MEEGGDCSLSNGCALLGRGAPNSAELRSFNRGLRWLCLDQSSAWKTALSWSVFFLLVVVSPLITHFFYVCLDCDESHRRPYDSVVQCSLSAIAALSFACLSGFIRKYGLRKFLFLDKLKDESDMVREGYTQQIRRSMTLLSFCVLPCFAAVSAYKIWWYSSGATDISYWGNIFVSDLMACTLQLSSWLYRTSIFFFVCSLFRLICYLQILRMEEFAQVFQKEFDVGAILSEHLRIRKNLKIISHRFRVFIVLTLLFVTASQLASLLMTTRSSANVNIYKAGELALCSISLVSGIIICLRSATKITHRAQAVTSLAAKWHVCATINSFDSADAETPTLQVASTTMFPVGTEWSEDECGDDDVDSTNVVPIHAHTISFQKRQALVTYLENNRAGVTVFGFVLDRSYLHTIFGVQLSLVLWLLSKTVGHSLAFSMINPAAPSL